MQKAQTEAPDEGYVDLPGLARYSGLSVSTLRRAIVDEEHPLPAYQVRVGGKTRGRVLVRKAEFDEWLRRGQRLPESPAAAVGPVRRVFR